MLQMNKYLILKNYTNFIVRNILNLFVPLIKNWEKKYFKKYGSQELKHQPVFIIGAPRTGSTILYQTLTNQLDVLYVDNLICRFGKNFFFGFWLSNKLFKQKAHNCFESNHGDTSACGFHAPSECGSFWYRWLTTDKHYIDYHDITHEMVNEIRKEITTVINYFDRPIIFNNNNIALRIRLIKKVFPNAKYIITDREPIFVSQSLLKARMYFYSDFNKWWSMMPKNYLELIKEPYFRQVVLQHYYINKQMYADLNKLTGHNNYILVGYRDLCIDRDKVFKIIINLFNYEKYKDSFVDNELFESRELSLDKDLLNKVKIEIEKLDWNDYKS
jgi:hypothetical protein